MSSKNVHGEGVSTELEPGAGVAGRASELVIEALGRQSTFWGLGKAPGEIYAALYLAREPLSLGAVAKTLGLTKGSVSVAVRPLEQLGMIRRSWRRGSRQVFFEAETDFYAIALSVLSRRHKPEFDASFRQVEEAEQLLEAQSPGAGEPEGEAALPEEAHMLGRLQSLRAFYRQLDRLVETVISMSPKELAEAMGLLAQVAQDLEKGGGKS